MQSNDKMPYKKRMANFIEKQGFYLILLVCVLVVGITAFVSFRGRNQAEDTPEMPVNISSDDTLSSVVTPSPLDVLSQPEQLVVNPATPTPLPEATATAKPKASTKQRTLPAPMEGQVSMPFANDSLVYSKTLSQWMTHPGVDIVAAEGTDVKCVESGVVERVWKDALMGNCISIKHENKRRSIYMSLKSEPTLKEGTPVNAGDVIGKCGKTAIAELEEGSHLHFEYYVDDKAVDPAKYITSLKPIT